MVILLSPIICVTPIYADQEGLCFFSHLIITLTGCSSQFDICVLYPA